ncbi:MAG: HD domain-containing protein [Eubacterium sp.]
MDNELYVKALAYANEKHAGQIRKDGDTPYIVHPIAVAELVRKAGYGKKYQIVALLHDTLEDTDATEEDLCAFGEDVVHAVKLLTRAKGADESEYVKNVLTDPMAAVVKNADKISNLYDSVFSGKVGEPRGEKMTKFAKKYIEKVRKYYEHKFSPALDDAIKKVDAMLDEECVRDYETPNYTQAEMQL